MNSDRPNRRRHRTAQRRFAPRLERVEDRALLSVSALLASLGGASSAQRAGMTGILQTQGIPTPRELKRQTFAARFKGAFAIGPGRFNDQITQISLSGGGISSSFLHGDLQMGIFTSKDPSQPANGQANLIVKNITDTGNELIVDLEAVPGAVDRAGRPTQFSWTVNGGSGGIWTNAEGQGTLEVQYRPGGKLPRRAFTAGTFGAVFQGKIATTGLNNTLRSQ